LSTLTVEGGRLVTVAVVVVCCRL